MEGPAHGQIRNHAPTIISADATNRNTPTMRTGKADDVDCTVNVTFPVAGANDTAVYPIDSGTRYGAFGLVVAAIDVRFNTVSGVRSAVKPWYVALPSEWKCRYSCGPEDVNDCTAELCPENDAINGSAALPPSYRVTGRGITKEPEKSVREPSFRL